MGELVAGMERVAIFKPVVLADGCAGLHRVDSNAGEGNFDAADVMGGGEGGVGLGFIALLHPEADVVCAIVPNRCAVLGQGLWDLDDRW